MPVCRSASARNLSESRRALADAGGASKTKKSLPRPCIFENSMRIGASIAQAPRCRERGMRRGLRKGSPGLTFRKNNNDGSYAPHHGLEFEGWVWKEHARHQSRGIFRA